MASSARTSSPQAPSGVDQLLKELSGYLAAQAEQLADKAADKLSDVTDQLYDVADNNGSLSDMVGIGGRLLQGDSPSKPSPARSSPTSRTKSPRPSAAVKAARAAAAR